MSQALEVWIDCDLCPLQQLGTLYHDRGTVRFEYHLAWLSNRLAFAIDPQLQLGEGVFFPDPEVGNFGIFMDSSPDRWGQTLMQRKESLQAKDAGEPTRRLYAWDYLIGVQDITRQGALRFRPVATEKFVAYDAFAAPPVTSLDELAEVARFLSQHQIDDLSKLKRWLAVLVAPGASLGGARPKANFIERDASHWIAKFPAFHDGHDIGAWEWVARTLAEQAGVDIPPARVYKFGRSGFSTFCVKRFDRNQGQRKFYASAMTLLGKAEATQASSSYLQLAQWMANQGDAQSIDAQLRQLFRRVALNIAIGNRDDHLRNHGFLLTSQGWQLSPAFDINPNADRHEHVLNIDELDNRPSLETLLNTAPFYRLSASQALQIINHVAQVVDGWRSIAKQAGLSAVEILELEPAFSAHSEYRKG